MSHENCLPGRPNPVARASNTPTRHAIPGRKTEAFVLHLATPPPLGDNGYVTEQHGNVDD
jgi:hypothetical protein